MYDSHVSAPQIVGSLGVTYNSSTKKATISGVDTSVPIMISVYVNADSNSNIILTISELQNGYFIYDKNTAENVYTKMHYGMSTSDTVTVDLSMSALVNPRILISAYQATIQ
jgi:hypothetical protein